MRKVIIGLLVMVLGLVLVACNKTVKIKFVTNGGEPIEEIKVKQKTIVELEDAVKEGHTFRGWYEDEGLSIEFIEANPVVRNYTLYAKWEINSYSITFVLNNGEDDVAVQGNFGSNINFPTPNRIGYQFEKWYLDADLSEPFNKTVFPAKDLTLYAKWGIKKFEVTGNYVFEEKDENDQFVETSRQEFVKFQDVAYQEEVKLVEEFEGYEVYKIEVNGNEVDIEDAIIITDDAVVNVYYRKLIMKVTFNDVISMENNKPVIQQNVYNVNYGSNLVNFDNPTGITGYSITWRQTIFNNVTEDIIVESIVASVTDKIVVFRANGIVIETYSQAAGQNIEASDDVWSKTIRNYQITDWKYSDESVKNQALAWNKFVSGINEVTAVTAELPHFEKPVNLDIEIKNDKVTITFEQAFINMIKPVEYNIYIDGIKVGAEAMARAEVTYDNEMVKIVFDKYVLEHFLRIGRHEIQVVAVGDGVETNSSERSAKKSFEVKKVADEDVDVSETGDYHIVQELSNGTKRYIVYKNRKYNFKNAVEVIVTEGGDSVSSEGQVLSAHGLGEFEFIVVTEQGEERYLGLVVANIADFELGKSYEQYLEKTGFMNDDEEINYLVGHSSEFYFDIRAISNTFENIALKDLELTYKIFENGVEIQTLSSIVDINGHIFNFTSAAQGRVFKVEVALKYQSLKMTQDSISFTVEINDGVNVFDHNELKDAYKDLNVRKINIHRTIVASLNANQLNPDGSPVNKREGSGVDIALTGNVYYRQANNVAQDDLVVEGNFMEVDGSKLPYSNKNSGSGSLSIAVGFEVINVQIGIFTYNVSSSEFNKETNALNNNQVSYNNLRVTGNSKMIVEGDSETEMTKNSGGYLGFVARNGANHLDNVVVSNTLIAITNNALGYLDETTKSPVLITLNNTNLRNSWANSIYLHSGSGLELTKTKIDASGGASIHYEDTRKGDGYENPLLRINEDVVFNNWVTGKEAWFTAYGMTQTVTGLKTSIDDEVSKVERRVIKIDKGERINFVFLSLPQSGAVSYDENNQAITGSEVIFDIEGRRVARRFNFIDSDPRVQDGAFAFAYGNLSEIIDFGSFVNELVTLGGAAIAPQAGELAFLAGFYNLTVLETLAIAQDPTIIPQLLQRENNPRFLEVVSPLPGYTGSVTVLLEFSN